MNELGGRDTPAPPLDVTIVIVSYNVRYFLEQCIHSVRVATDTLRAEIIVVDNASSDDSVAYLRAQPDVRTIANEDNVGFARANNQGIRQARGRYVLLLNPDTLVESDALRRCLASADHDPTIGVIGARMLDGTGRYLPESKRGLPTPWVSFTKMSGLGRLAPRSARFNGYYLGHLRDDAAADVDVLPGAFMWLRREALAAVGGGLDEDYFMYGEDVDLSYSIQRAGYRVVYDPAVQIIHYKGESTRKRSWHHVKAFYRAMAIFSRKHLSGGSSTQQPLLEAAIYGRAALAVATNAFAKTLPALVDALALVGTLLAVKACWARWYFRDASYYADSNFNLVNVPLYVGLWVVTLALSGAYDKPYRLWSAARGMLIGTLGVLGVYALLPAELHTSRAVVLLTAGLGTLVLLALRLAWALVRPGEVLLSRASVGHDRRLAIVGSAPETERALAIMARVGVARDFVGRLSPKPVLDSGDTLGGLGEVESVARALGVDELVVCLDGIPVERLTAWMRALGPGIAYRTLAPGSGAIVGSPSRDTPGELYALRRNFAIAQPSSRRAKRILDVGLAAGLLLAFPLALATSDPLGTLRNAVLVLLGQLTWVGYGAGLDPGDGLPRLRPCVLPRYGAPVTRERGAAHGHLEADEAADSLLAASTSPCSDAAPQPSEPSDAVHAGGDLMADTRIAADYRSRANEAYARYWRLSDDLRTLWTHRRQLGRAPLAIRRLSPPRRQSAWLTVQG